MEINDGLEQVLSEAPTPPPLPALLTAVNHEYQQAEEARQEGEYVLVSVWTPEGPLIAEAFDFREPNVLVVHGLRRGHQTIFVTPMDSAQISIETIPTAPPEKQLSFGFTRE